MFAAAERLGIEGIVSKRASSRYRSGPAKAWAKTKCTTEGEFVLIGSKLEGKIPTLLLARETSEGLVYAGSAFLSMPEPMREVLRTTCERIKIDRPTVDVRSREAWWFRPELRIRVKHLRGESGMLRHASALVLSPNREGLARAFRSEVQEVVMVFYANPSPGIGRTTFEA